MVDWLWGPLLIVIRIFVILSVFTFVGIALAALYAWWNGAEPWAAWTVAFWMVVLAGFAWYWWIS